jgi:hypothetical protein
VVGRRRRARDLRASLYAGHGAMGLAAVRGHRHRT